MIRATTPTHEFMFPEDIDPSACEKILVTYKQADQIVIELSEEDLTIEGQSVSYTFTQEQANLFSRDYVADVQIRILLEGGEALASNIVEFNVNDVLNDEVLS